MLGNYNFMVEPGTAREVVGIGTFVEALGMAGNVRELRSLFASVVQDCGFENYMLASSSLGNRQPVVYASQLPEGFLARYLEQGWQHVDPFLQKTMTSRQPFFWSELTNMTDLSGEQGEFVRESAALGVHSGFTLPFHGPDKRVDAVSLSHRENAPAPCADRQTLTAIGTQFYFRYLELKPLPDNPEPSRSPLTEREVECLGWCGRGKTSWEISVILDISEKTAQFHISNAIAKLKSPNRTAAVVAALRQGIICL